MIALMLLLGWALYLICNVLGRKYPRRIYVRFITDIDIKILKGGFSCTRVNYSYWCRIYPGSTLTGVITTTRVVKGMFSSIELLICHYGDLSEIS
jgi:hypothetical protein